MTLSAWRKALRITAHPTDTRRTASAAHDIHRGFRIGAAIGLFIDDELREFPREFIVSALLDVPRESGSSICAVLTPMFEYAEYPALRVCSLQPLSTPDAWKGTIENPIDVLNFEPEYGFFFVRLCTTSFAEQHLGLIRLSISRNLDIALWNSGRIKLRRTFEPNRNSMRNTNSYRRKIKVAYLEEELFHAEVEAGDKVLSFPSCGLIKGKKSRVSDIANATGEPFLTKRSCFAGIVVGYVGDSALLLPSDALIKGNEAIRFAKLSSDDARVRLSRRPIKALAAE